MNFIEILLGQLPEAIYFALFMILSKGLKTKRTTYIILSCIYYLILLNAFPYNTWSHVLFFIFTYITLKYLYKERSQITDVFTLGIASLLIVVISILIYFILSKFTAYIILGNIVQKIILFSVLFLLRNQLPKIQGLYNKLWNRNDKIPKRIKSTTFRVLNVVTFNFMFYVINIFLLYCLFIKK